MIAIDNDSTAVNKLRQSIEEKGLTSKFELMCGDFHATQARGDVVLFEFSLHEMNDPAAALQRSRAMAPDTVVFDHSPGSEWAYYIAEDEKVKSSWNAIESCAIRKSIHYDAIQRFATYQELYDKVKPQGQASINRIKRFESARDITIPMKYGIALL